MKRVMGGIGEEVAARVWDRVDTGLWVGIWRRVGAMWKNPVKEGVKGIEEEVGDGVGKEV